MESVFSQYSSTGQVPRSTRDAGIAAAIAVSLALALETSPNISYTPAPPGDTPWVVSGRTTMNTLRSGFQIQKNWGLMRGWRSSPGDWRMRRK